jgi:hypothetical protein
VTEVEIAADAEVDVLAVVVDAGAGAVDVPEAGAVAADATVAMAGAVAAEAGTKLLAARQGGSSR